jgi:hypothetical protein
MGTNFYYKIPIHKRKVEELKNLITEEPDFTELLNKIEEITKNNSIHLGKRSAGWQFLWDYHDGRFYKDNLNSIKEFINTSEGYIENEYGEKFTSDEFFDDEIKACLYKDKTHCDIKAYQKNHPNESFYYNPNDVEYISIDGLRFSTSENFS